MGRLKDAMLAQALVGKKPERQTIVKGDPYDDPTDSRPPKIVRARKPKVDRSPSRFTYALKSYVAEIRSDGWWITRSWMVSVGEKPRWAGPFATIEDTCLAIARRLATEIADRHTTMSAAHDLKPGQPLYGLKPSTRLPAKTAGKA